ncbi:hypothetical protein PQR05_12905, partial [Paraburkholderia sediminicola]|uniref:hypothetical protein n=1 Tax=Paraburkholderia sediminicola TaxID=458836 RepID=UPI0038B8F6EA
VPAPHRGDANKPIRIQGKANAIGNQTRRAEQTNRSRKGQRHRPTAKQAPSRQTIQENPTAAGKQTKPAKGKSITQTFTSSEQ